MNGNIIELLQKSIEVSAGNNDCLKEFFESCLQHGAFYKKDNTETVIKNINACLNSPFDKEKGLLLLSAYLSQTSVDAFSKNAVSWMVHCNKIIHQKGEIIDGLGLKVLSKLIKLSVKFPDVTKETAKQVVPKFLLDHVRRRTNSQVSLELLECIQACMSEYSGPSGEFKADIQCLLLGTIEARAEVVRAAAQCIPLLARLRGGGKQGISYKTAWKSQQLALVAALHTLLNNIYQHIDCITPVEVKPQEDVHLTLDPVSERNILYKSQRLATQFRSLSQFLQAMLLEEFPVAKSVFEDAILDVVAHAQKPTHSALGTSREALAVVSVLPSIQVASLRLLESLVLCLGRNLVPWAGLVCHLCSQVLLWTQQQLSDWPYAMDKPYSEARLAVYCCLYSWVSVSGSASIVHTLVDKSLPAILADIHTEKPTVRLKVGSKSSKGKKKQQMLVSQEDRSEKLVDSVANRRLCERALLTLSLLLKAAAPTLKAETVTSIVETVLTVVAELPVPYRDADCLSALYQLLLTLCLNPHPSLAPPLAHGLSIFTAGLHHPSPQVKATCVSALGSLEKIIHPTAATLCFPLPQEKQKPLAREPEESDGSESETEELAVKRRKVDAAEDEESIVSIVLDDSDDELSVLPLHSKTDEGKMNWELSNDSVKVVEVLPATSKQADARGSSNKSPRKIEEIVIGEETNKEIESTTEEINIEEDINEEILVDNNDDKDKITNENINVKEDIANINEISADTPVDTTNVVELPETNDPDVSQMLLDFNDEINNDNVS